MCTKLKGPDMKYFHENLDRVVRGEWWLWDSAYKVECAVLVPIVITVGSFLAYDYFGYADEYLG